MSNMNNRRSSTEEIKNIVTDGYRNILKREPDPGGFEHYIHYISSGGITKERFLEILRNSEEYKRGITMSLHAEFLDALRNSEECKGKVETSSKFISVLIRTHKRPKSLRTCLNSLSGQTRNNFCIVIISDHKDDNVEELIDEYPSLCFVFEHVTPLGYPSCNLYYNQVKSVIDSGYVIFIDDDDEIIDNTYLKILEDTAVKNGFPAVIMSRALYYGNTVIPGDVFWTNLPSAGNVGTLNFCVRTDMYRSCDWTNDGIGDFHFINSVFNSINWRRDVYWYNKITVAARNYPGLGKGEY